MIEPDPIEYLDSDFTDDELRLVEALCGPHVREKLLIPREIYDPSASTR